MKLIDKIKFFPISFYSVVMGILGLVIAIQKTTDIFKLSNLIPNMLLVISFIIFCFITLMILLKLILHKEEFIKDFLHPIKISFFPTISISLLLFSIALLPTNPQLSLIFWIPGTIIHVIFTMIVISMWIRRFNYKIEHLNPAWFIPVVGNLLIPIAGIAFVSNELLWFFFSIGIIFWIILTTIVIYRLFFHEPLNFKMRPTMFILIAPPAVSTISYFKLTGMIDNFSRILYNFSLFITLLLLINIRMFINKQFYLSEWALTFPLAAISIASALMFHSTGKIYYFLYLHLIFLTLATAIITILIYRTIRAIYFNEICQED